MNMMMLGGLTISKRQKDPGKLYWQYADPKPQDLVKVRCDKSPDDDLFKVGEIYKGCWAREVRSDGAERVKPYICVVDARGDCYSTYRPPWFEFTIVEGPTEPPKE